MSDTYDLKIVQNATYTLGFSDGVTDFRNYNVRAQVRAKELKTSTLLLDLSPYFTASDDGTTLTLRVPGIVTAAVDASKFPAVGAPKAPAKWDLVLISKTDPTESEVFIEGNAYCNPSPTDMEVAS